MRTAGGVNITRLVMVLTTAAVACAPAARGNDEKPEPNPGLFVMVRNENLADVDVYAVRLGFKYRLGTVVAHASDRFRVPETLLNDNELRLYVHLIGGGGEYWTEPIQIDNQTEPRLDLQPVITMSSFYAVLR
jgi:hypothetical protein